MSSLTTAYQAWGMWKAMPQAKGLRTMEHNKAQSIADQWIELLRPHCIRIEQAGSLLRGKPDVKDIDIVCIPKILRTRDLFGDATNTVNYLELEIMKLWERRAFLAITKRGPRYKQLCLLEGIHLELWIVTPPAQWGWIKVLRTGPEDFTTWLVTSRRNGGALPSYLHMKNGALWHRTRMIETPEEMDFFKAIGMEYIEPAKRVAHWVKS